MNNGSEYVMTHRPDFVLVVQKDLYLLRDLLGEGAQVVYAEKLDEKIEAGFKVLASAWKGEHGTWLFLVWKAK